MIGAAARGRSEPSLTDQQRALLQRVFEVFHESSKWPTYQYMKRYAQRQLGVELAKIVQGMAQDYSNVWVPHLRDEEDVRLLAPALAECAGADEDIKAFLVVLKRCIQLWLDSEPDSPHAVTAVTVTSAEIASSTGLSVQQLVRVHHLMQFEPGIWRSAGGPAEDGTWDMVLSDDVTRYRNVESFDDYLAIAHPKPAPPKVETRVAKGFLLMPFDEKFDWLHAEIREAGAEVGVEIDRADDIFEGGVVIDQVRGRIRAADVVIAVCTDRNPNVFYELGIATETHRPILIAESKADLPFDIQHFRAQMYGGQSSQSNRATLRTRLAAAMRETIPGELAPIVPKPLKAELQMVFRHEPPTWIEEERRYRIGVHNSGDIAAENVEVKLNSIKPTNPLPVDVLPSRLGRKGGGTDNCRINPGATDYFDVLTRVRKEHHRPNQSNSAIVVIGVSGPRTLELWTESHSGQNFELDPDTEYELAVEVFASNAQPLSRRFKLRHRLGSEVELELAE